MVAAETRRARHQPYPTSRRTFCPPAECTIQLRQPVEDGIDFSAGTATAEVIREEDDYSGVRVHAEARLSSARLAFHVDVNVGDPIWPEPVTVALPRLRGGEPIELRGYRSTWSTPRRSSPRSSAAPPTPGGVTSVTSGACTGGTRSAWATFGARATRSRATGTRECCHWPSCSPDSRLSRRAGGRNGAVTATPAQFETILQAVIAFADPVLTGEASAAAVSERTCRAGRRLAVLSRLFALQGRRLAASGGCGGSCRRGFRWRFLARRPSASRMPAGRRRPSRCR